MPPCGIERHGQDAGGLVRRGHPRASEVAHPVPQRCRAPWSCCATIGQQHGARTGGGSTGCPSPRPQPQGVPAGRASRSWPSIQAAGHDSIQSQFRFHRSLHVEMMLLRRTTGRTSGSWPQVARFSDRKPDDSGPRDTPPATGPLVGFKVTTKLRVVQVPHLLLAPHS